VVLKTIRVKVFLSILPSFTFNLKRIPLQHIEFFHTDHFENDYHRVKPLAALGGFIDFFWETKFDGLLQQYPEGFSDVLLPNVGYTYIINLGTPFIMQVENKNFEMKTDGFLPRHKAIECYHRPGNCLFGIKFKISPVIFKTKVNFSEYRGYIYPLSYLLEQPVIDQVKKTKSFAQRVDILNRHFLSIITTYAGTWEPIRIVSEILQHCDEQNDFTASIKSLATQYHISPRTLHRYFETTTSFSSKKALQIMRIRKAVSELSGSPHGFSYRAYGYYDHSHFCKHLKQFLQKETLLQLRPHLQLLERLHKK